MESTKISAEKTASEIMSALVKAGVSAVHTEYKDKKVVALSFSVEVNADVDYRATHTVPFRLPVRADALFCYFQNRRDSYNQREAIERDRAKAERVAWRQIYRWILAQLALVETGMVKVEEVFLPYAQTDIDETLFQKLESAGFEQITAPKFEQITAPEEAH